MRSRIKTLMHKIFLSDDSFIEACIRSAARSVDHGHEVIARSQVIVAAAVSGAMVLLSLVSVLVLVALKRRRKSRAGGGCIQVTDDDDTHGLT